MVFERMPLKASRVSWLAMTSGMRLRQDHVNQKYSDESFDELAENGPERSASGP